MDDSAPAPPADRSPERQRRGAATREKAWALIAGLLAPAAVGALALFLLLGNASRASLVASSREQAVPPTPTAMALARSTASAAPTWTPSALSALAAPPSGGFAVATAAAEPGNMVGTPGTTTNGVAVAGASADGRAGVGTGSAQLGDSSIAPSAPLLARAGASRPLAPIAAAGAAGAALAALGAIWRRLER